jgi:hypothetical protein
LNAHPNAKITVYAIWLPMLAGDSRGAWDRHVLDDPRVVSLWDGSRLAGKWFADHSLGRLGGPGAWFGMPTSRLAQTRDGGVSLQVFSPPGTTSSTTPAGSSGASSHC